MLTYSRVACTESGGEVDKRRARGPYDPSLGNAGILHAAIEDCARASYRRALNFRDHKASDMTTATLNASPAEVVTRRAMAWEGIRVEVVQCVTHDKIELRFSAPCHLLVAYQEGFREEGETLIDDAPRSTLRTLAGKLNFVPAGYDYREWQRPRVRSRLVCFYFDPDKMRYGSDLEQMATFTPRLFFENTAMWEAAAKLAAAMENNPEAQRYCEALAIIVAHELLSMHGHFASHRPSTRGGLAAWQQRVVASYIHEHLAEQIPIADLAALVELSCYHFCRAFKQSFGEPPHHYHIQRRVERAKTLLESTAMSITEMAVALGFSETSSFSTAFRQATGAAPTEYRRALG
jgi:AraC family transcriptional regulator